MYHRLLNIWLATQDPQLEMFLRAVPPLERFSHQFLCSPGIEEADLHGCAVIILDLEPMSPEFIEKIYADKDEQAAMIGCCTPECFSTLAATAHLFDQIWSKPFAQDAVQTSFAKILARRKEREDAVLTQRYLDTLIDSLPDLIWFKDARGAHLKVNSSFCRTVNKTKAQIEGRGHYYIWDLEPDEYAQGEYICLESEEIVLDKKETCLFDETVKCGDELRKFKTYKSPIFDTDDQVIGTVGFAHDVTDLQNLLIELNILVESLPFAVIVIDKDGMITSVNQKCIDIFLIDRADLIGNPIASFVDESKKFTLSKRWIIEREEEGTLLLSKHNALKIQRENLLDIFGVQAGQVYIFVDVTFEHQQKNKLLVDANTDHLTKLNNRRSLHDFMRKTPCKSGTTLLLVDLDNFKDVNDKYGHDEGDRVLIAFAELLQQLFPAENLFRLGGDEFAIILHGLKDATIPQQYARNLLHEFETSLARQFSYTDISLSIGIAMDEDKGWDFGELFKKADMALYDSKESGKSTYTLSER